MSSVQEVSIRNEGDLRREMAGEATRIEHWGRVWDASYRGLARQWWRGNTTLVVSAAALAAAAGATGLGKAWSGSLWPGLLALAAAVVSGTAGALGASNRATQYNSAAASNSGLADAARVFRATVVHDLPISEVRHQFEALCKRRDAVVNSAPVSGKPKKLSTQQLEARAPGSSPHS